MKMTFTPELGGIHPRSEQLIDLTRSYDRGKTDRASVERQIEQDTLDLVRLEETAGIEDISDGAFSWQDQLRPLVESLEGVTTGTRYSRWFDTNTFFKKPIINGKVGLGAFDFKKFIRTDLLPKSKRSKVTLIGPYTFSELAENLHYKAQPELISDVARAEREIIRKLESGGVSRFQISEPCLVYRPYRENPASDEELKVAINALRNVVAGIKSPVTVQTYFGDATAILPDLLNLQVDGVGFDIFETDFEASKIKTEKKLVLGIVDSRESNVEDPKWIAQTATHASKHLVSERIGLAPNSDLKFVPRKVADAKARSLAEATKMIGRAQ